MSVSANQRSRKMLPCTAEATAYQKAFGQELHVDALLAIALTGFTASTGAVE